MRISQNKQDNKNCPDHHATQTSPVPTYPQTNTISTNTSPIPPVYQSKNSNKVPPSSHSTTPFPPTTSTSSCLQINKQEAKQILSKELGDAMRKDMGSKLPSSPPSAAQNNNNNSESVVGVNSNLYQRKYQSFQKSPISPASHVHSPTPTTIIPSLSISSQNINVIGGSKRISQDLPNKLQHSTSYVDNSTKDHNSYLQQSTPALHHNIESSGVVVKIYKINNFVIFF